MMMCFDCEEESGLREWTNSVEEVKWTIGIPAKVLLCFACWTKRDNYEPPDPDGEDYCRDLNAEYRDAMIEAQKLK